MNIAALAACRWSLAVLLTLLSGVGLKAQQLVSNLGNYFPGEPIQIGFSGGPGNTKDWIGIYPEGVTPGSVGSTLWFYVDGTRSGNAGLRTGSVTFGTGLNLAGNWNAFFLLNDGYEVLTNLSFTILDPSAAAVRPSQRTFAPGQAITVGFTNGPANPKDWIGVYRADQTPGGVGSTIWNYVDGTRSGATGLASGSVSFATGLAQEGEYQVYLLENDGYTILAGERITVATPVFSGPSLLTSTPSNGSTNAFPDAAFAASITNGTGTAVAPATVRLTLDGTQVAASVVANGGLVTVAYTNAALLPQGSAHTYVLSFSDTSVPPVVQRVTNAFSIRAYRNIELPAPLVFENFNAVAEGSVPAGWTLQSYVPSDNTDIDFGNLDSAAFANWTVVDAARFNGRFITYSNPETSDGEALDYLRVNRPNPANVVGGRVLREPLASGRFLFSTSGYRRGGSQVFYAFTPDFNMTGRTNVHVGFKSLYEQNQDSIGALEYSVDGGTNWMPVAYLIDGPDIVRTESGAVDAVATLTAERGDTATYTDENGNLVGGTYGAFIAAPISESLAPFIEGRVNDDFVESKRQELYRLPMADNQARVRLRFAYAGTDSWYWGVDDLGLYALGSTNTPPTTNAPTAFTFLNLNNPVTGSVSTNTDGSLTVTAGGGDTYDRADSFSYLYEPRMGDFDVQVRVLGVDADDATGAQRSAKASLHVRANLTPGSPNIQVSATPMTGANYVETISRPVQDGNTDDPPSGSPRFGDGPWEGTYRPVEGDLLPVWLRVRRERNLFQTYYSTDGIRWNVLAEYQLDGFPTNAFVGLATVAHIGGSEDTNNRVRSTYAGYRNTPFPPLALVGDQPAGTNGPGQFPNRTVTAVNWKVSLPADGIGFTPDLSSSGPILWNTGGFGSISRDILVSVDGEQGPVGFSMSRYAQGALDFGIGPRDTNRAQENLGPYSNPLRRRIGTPESTEVSAQSWFPSPRHGVLVPTTRRIGTVQWNDGAAPFHPHTFMAVDGSSTRHYNMDNGIFGGGDFYLRMAKLGDTATHPDPGANSAGGFQRAAFDNSVAWFPYSQGWKGGYFADASSGARGRWSRPVSHSAAASEGTFAVDRVTAAALLRWTDLGGETFGGLGTLSLPGVDSRGDGMVFLTGNDDTTARGPQVNCAVDTNGGWTVAVRSVEENRNDPATYAAADKSEFSFVYVPYSAGNLVGGQINGTTGAAERRAGNFTATRLSAGRYSITIPGKTGANGMLVLQPVGTLTGTPSVVDNVTLAYQASGDGFIVEARALSATASSSPSVVTLRDAGFYFAWVDFAQPLTPAAADSVQTPLILSASIANGEVTVSWTGGVGPFLLQATGDLNDAWVNILTTTNRSATLPLLGSELFFRVTGGATNTVRLFKATLTGAAERPTPVVTPGSGVGIAAFEGSRVFYYAEYRNLRANTTAAHFHGPAGVEASAGVLLGLVHDGTPGRTGVYSGTANAPAGLLDAAAAGNVYYNIHSAAPDGVPGGEVRGQLVPVP